MQHLPDKYYAPDKLRQKNSGYPKQTWLSDPNSLPNRIVFGRQNAKIDAERERKRNLRKLHDQGDKVRYERKYGIQRLEVK